MLKWAHFWGQAVSVRSSFCLYFISFSWTYSCPRVLHWGTTKNKLFFLSLSLQFTLHTSDCCCLTLRSKRNRYIRFCFQFLNQVQWWQPAHALNPPESGAEAREHPPGRCGRKKKWAEKALSAIYWYFASRKTRLKISHTTRRWELTSSRAMG